MINTQVEAGLSEEGPGPDQSRVGGCGLDGNAEAGGNLARMLPGDLQLGARRNPHSDFCEKCKQLINCSAQSSFTPTFFASFTGERRFGAIALTFTQYFVFYSPHFLHYI